MKRSEKARLKNEEKDYKEAIKEKVIAPLNKIILKTHLNTTNKIIDCLENPNLSDKEAYKCKGKVDSEFKQKMERYNFFINEFEKKINGCLGGCKNDFSIEIVDCYQDCLRKFKGYAEKLDFGEI